MFLSHTASVPLTFQYSQDPVCILLIQHWTLEMICWTKPLVAACDSLVGVSSSGVCHLLWVRQPDQTINERGGEFLRLLPSHCPSDLTVVYQRSHKHIYKFTVQRTYFNSKSIFKDLSYPLHQHVIISISAGSLFLLRLKKSFLCSGYW